MNENDFIGELKKLGVSLEKDQLENLNKYYEILIEWNKNINLTAITNKEDVYLKHFYDSLTLIKAIDLSKKLDVCDIGTGAGFPGIVLKIVFPSIKLTLVDSMKKRTNFLEDVIVKINLSDCRVVNDRAEDFIRKNRETFDLITCRAVSKLSIISEICIPGVRIAGYFIPMKGNVEEELRDTSIIEKLGAKIEKIITFKLPKEDSNRNLIIIKKVLKTNEIYPRDYNKIIKS